MFYPLTLYNGDDHKMVNDDSSPEENALVPVGDEEQANDNIGQTSTENYGESQTDTYSALGRRDTMKLAAGGIIGLGGLGGLFALSSYGGGNAEGSSPVLNDSNGSLNASEENMFNPPRDDTESDPIEDVEFDNESEDDSTELDGNVYFIEGSLEIDIDSLDPIMDSSDVVLGIQDNGNLIAYNEDVETDEGYNPLWRFRSDVFPDPEFYDAGNQHPIEELYEEVDGDTDQMTEEMVNVFYDENQDDGDWEDHSEYVEVSFSELKDGLLEYGSLGEAQDYFFDRTASLEDDEPVLESEWRELLQDGLEAENGY